jgi:type I restriction enzyme S subunit
MNTSWTSCTIQDLQNKGEAELKTGPFGTQLHASDYVETGTPVINVRNIGFGEIREEKLEFIAEETVQRLSSHLLEPGDIVFGRKGAVERHAFINPKYTRWFQGSDCLRLRVKSPSVDSRFLSYYFLTEHHKQWMINQCSHGATMASLNQAIISRIPLLLPSIHTQRKIISILSAYDDLIENNTRRIEILEEMARSLYREWFVNFRFPGHEQVKMVDSELGLIPEGWEVKKLGEVIRFKNGKSIKAEEQGDYLVYGSNGIIGRTNESKYQNAIIIGRVGAYCGSLIYSKSAFNASDNTIIAESASEKICIELVFYVLEQMNLRHYAGGAAQPLLTQAVIKEIPVIVPDIKTNKNFQIIIENLLDLKSTLTNKIQNLRKTRDLLLPKLISGEIDLEKITLI